MELVHELLLETRHLLTLSVRGGMASLNSIVCNLPHPFLLFLWMVVYYSLYALQSIARHFQKIKQDQLAMLDAYQLHSSSYLRSLVEGDAE